MIERLHAWLWRRKYMKWQQAKGYAQVPPRGFVECPRKVGKR